jgi:predicted PurR-regulated permease PerM
MLILFISVLFAATLAGPAEYLTRFRVPRIIAVLIIYLAFGALMALIGWIVVLPILNEISNLGEELPDYADRIEGARSAYEELREDYPQLATFDEQFSELGARISDDVGNTLIGLPTTLIRLAFDALSVFFISIMLVTNRERIMAVTLSVIHPGHRDHWENVLTKIWSRMGRYLRAKLIVMLIVGALMYAGLFLLEVRFPLLLAIIVALGQLIPRIGVWFARVPLLAVAALDGTEMVIYVAALSVAIENLKGYVISPFVEGDQLNIHPLLVFVSVLVGGALLGVAGAFIAVPAAAAAQVVFEEVILPWRTSQFEAAPASATETNPESVLVSDQNSR